MDKPTEAYLEWWNDLTDATKESLTDQFHQEYGLFVKKELSDGEIRLIYNRRRHYDW